MPLALLAGSDSPIWHMVHNGMLEPNITCHYCKDTGHIKDDHVQLNNKSVHEIQLQEQVATAKLTTKKSTRPHIPHKIGSSQILDQSGGDKVCGQDQFDQMTN